MALSLFGGAGGSGSRGGGPAGPKNIVEFRAGKMNLKGNTVSPDKRKGLVYVYQSDDSLVHFCWKDRKTGTVEDDLIIFPDDCELKKCTQSKEGSRVFLLKFKASARKLFFWMQEPKAEGDEDLVSKVNDALNGGAGASGAGGVRGSDSSENVTPSGSETDMQNLLGNMSQSQLMQLLGGMSNMGESGLLAQLNQIAPGLASLAAGGGGGTGGAGSKGASSILKKKPTTTQSGGTAAGAGATAAPATTGNSVPPPTAAPSATGKSSGTGIIQLEDLQQILNRMQPGNGVAGAGAGVDLASAVNSDSIRRITSCPKTVQKLAPLLPQFGYESPTPTGGTGNVPTTPTDSGASPSPSDELKAQKQVQETLQSPQFQSALSSFCAAFPTGQLGPLISQFGMGPEAVSAAKNGNLEAFLNAIQKEVEAEDGGDQGGEPIESDMNAVD